MGDKKLDQSSDSSQAMANAYTRCTESNGFHCLSHIQYRVDVENLL